MKEEATARLLGLSQSFGLVCLALSIAQIGYSTMPVSPEPPPLFPGLHTASLTEATAAAALPRALGAGPEGAALCDQLLQHWLPLSGNSPCPLLRWRGLLCLAPGDWLYRDAPAASFSRPAVTVHTAPKNPRRRSPARVRALSNPPLHIPEGGGVRLRHLI